MFSIFKKTRRIVAVLDSRVDRLSDAVYNARNLADSKLSYLTLQNADKDKKIAKLTKQVHQLQRENVKLAMQIDSFNLARIGFRTVGKRAAMLEDRYAKLLDYLSLEEHEQEGVILRKKETNHD